MNRINRKIARVVQTIDDKVFYPILTRTGKVPSDVLYKPVVWRIEDVLNDARYELRRMTGKLTRSQE